MGEIIQHIDITLKQKRKTLFNPFPGLRPYSIKESHLFFGREGQSDEVLSKLAENRFVAVIGTSGSGKSSLMYCGLTPILYGGFLTEAGSQWRLIISRPGGGPINNLADALVKSDFSGKVLDEDIYFKKAITSSILRSSSLGLVEAVRQLNTKKGENILIMIDQFEELFRYKKSRKDQVAFNESLAFVKLLLEAVKQKELPIYIILTMRSDFIGECAQFQDLTGLINDSHYLIPQMTRSDLYNAIVGPVAVAGGAISSRLVHHLLNDVGDNPDQLPILQHSLMRTWDYWIYHHKEDEPIDVIHYEAIGGMEKALSEHANEAYDELSEKGKYLCEKIFKSLTEQGPDNRGIRHPSTIKELMDIGDVSEEEIFNVLEKFRRPGRSFLSPSYEYQLNQESIIDISHESLMRIWDRLIIWVEEEATAVKMYLRLAEAAQNHQKGKTSLWRPPDLHLATSWKKEQQPTLSWALRYHPAFERTMTFLANSEKEYLAEEQNKIRQQKSALRRSRIFALILGIAAIISLGFMLYALVAQVEARKSEGKAKIEKINAYRQKLISDINTKIAEFQSKKAIENEGRAKLEQVKAIMKTLQAELNARIAIIESRNAQFQKTIADQKKTEAEENAVIASEQKVIADKASLRADTLRMLSIAQSMAVKSLQINRDTVKKAIVSYQAYLFNKEYKGPSHNADIHSALYFANKLANNDRNDEYFTGHSSSVRSLIFIPNTNSFVSTGSDKKIIKWNLKNPENPDTLINQVKDIIRTFAVSPDGKYLACGSQQAFIQLFDLKSGNRKPIKIFKAHNDAIAAIRFTPDGKFMITAGFDLTIKIWNNFADSARSKIISINSSKIRSIDLSANGMYLAGGLSDGTVNIWNFNEIYKNGFFESSFEMLNMPVIKRFKRDSIPVLFVKFDNKAGMLAYGDEKGAVNIINLHNYEINSLTGQTARISQIEFSPDGTVVAASSFDGTVQIWETKNLNTQPILLRDNNSWVWSIAFTPNSKELITGYKDGMIQIWPIDIDLLAQLVKPSITRNMTLKEWDSFVGKDIKPRKISNRPLDKDVTERIDAIRQQDSVEKNKNNN